ncbi:hypothetical protein FB451DRAFT_633897 [Mycena latifolia]|nr:hypothetical protein FB451DRAFT_633897 [Mycena latifolia]
MNRRSVSFLACLAPQLGRRSLHRSSARRAIMMPYLSPFMTSGSIRRWAKKEGEAFLAGDVLLQIESDYITSNVHAENPGIMGKILRPNGSTNVPVEQVIALVAISKEELERLQAQTLIEPPPPPPPKLNHHKSHFHHSVNRGLEHAKSRMMSSAHHTSSVFEMNAVHSSGAATVRGIAMDHAGSQHSARTPRACGELRPPDGNTDQAAVLRKILVSTRESGELRQPEGNTDQATVLRKTIVSTLSRRGSGSESQSSKKCTTTQYFDGIL